VSVARLVALADECAPGTTTEQLVEQRIRPLTRHHNCRFVDLLTAADVAAPQYFISHRWKMAFSQLVDMLVAFCGANADLARIFVWLDVCAVYQNTRDKEDV
jgi:hypothetical protein